MAVTVPLVFKNFTPFVLLSTYTGKLSQKITNGRLNGSLVVRTAGLGNTIICSMDLVESGLEKIAIGFLGPIGETLHQQWIVDCDGPTKLTN